MKSFFSALTISFAILFLSSAYSQSNHSNLWSDISEAGLDAQGTRYIIPQAYRLMQLDLGNLESVLEQVPSESTIRVNDSEFLLSLPTPDGNFITFKVVKSPVMAEELATKYPNTEYGKQAITALKEEIPKLKAEIEREREQAKQSPQKKPLGVALPIAGAAVAVIVIAGVIMFLRKKKLNKAE